MSPYRIVISFAVAAFAVYQGMTHPGMSTFWYILAGVSFVVAIVRIMQYRKARSQGTTDQETKL